MMTRVRNYRVCLLAIYFLPLVVFGYVRARRLLLDVRSVD